MKLVSNRVVWHTQLIHKNNRFNNVNSILLRLVEVTCKINNMYVKYISHSDKGSYVPSK